MLQVITLYYIPHGSHRFWTSALNGVLNTDLTDFEHPHHMIYPTRISRIKICAIRFHPLLARFKIRVTGVIRVPIIPSPRMANVACPSEPSVFNRPSASQQQKHAHFFCVVFYFHYLCNQNNSNRTDGSYGKKTIPYRHTDI